MSLVHHKQVEVRETTPSNNVVMAHNLVRRSALECREVAEVEFVFKFGAPLSDQDFRDDYTDVTSRLVDE